MAFLRNLLKITSVSAAFVLIASASLAYADVDVNGFNGTTGPRSINRSEVETNRDWRVRVENNERITRDFNTDVFTGGNEVNRNTLVGDQLGGDIDVSITGSNTDLTNGFGFFDLPAIGANDVTFSGGNSITGPNSLNTNEIEANQRTRIDLINNARVNNNVNFRARTGGNEVACNTSVGDINSGDVNVNADLSTGTQFSGGLSNFNTGSLMDNNVSATFDNQLTGPNSENTNQLRANSNISERVENNMVVDNNLDFRVDTGNNEVDGNTSVGNIQTGNVNISAVVD